MVSQIQNYDNCVILVRFISDFRDQAIDTCTMYTCSYRCLLSINDIIIIIIDYGRVKIIENLTTRLDDNCSMRELVSDI
jgi:hypothetical protein